MSTYKINYLGRVRNANAVDIVVGIVATILVDLLVELVALTALVRTAVTLPVLLFFPGYFVLAAVFPRSSANATAVSGSLWQRPESRIRTSERLVLSYGVSLAILPMLVLLLSALSVDLTTETILGGVSAIILVCAPLAVARRVSVPEEQRYEPLRTTQVTDAVDNVRDQSRRELAVNGALVLAVCLGLAVAGGAIMAQPQQASYTELAVLTENGQGDLVAGDYPSSVAPDEAVPLVLEVENHGDQSQSYTVVVQAQRVDGGEVVERAQVERFSPTVDGQNTWRQSHDATVPFEGDRVRLSYLLYEGSPADEPTLENADESVYLWLNSTASS